MEKETATKSLRSLRPSPNAMLNPRCDANFKALFTDNSPESRLALKSFLEAVLVAKVSNIELRPNEMAVESERDKQARFDITCTLNDKEAVNIEMQGLDIHSHFGNRAEYHVAHLLNHYTPKGTAWKDVPKVFQISVLNFIYDATTPKTFSVYKMQTADNHRLADRMAVIFIELPKVIVNVSDDIENLTAAEKWAKFLVYADDESKQDYIAQLCKSEEGIMAAQVTLAKISEDEANWLRQDSLDMAQRDYLSAMSEATQRGLEDGWNKGWNQGHEAGFEKGMQDGWNKGHEDGWNKGHEDGWNKGHEDGWNKGHEDGWNKGHEDGWNKGHEDGWNKGHEKGMQDGLEQGRQAQYKEDQAQIAELSARIRELESQLKK